MVTLKFRHEAQQIMNVGKLFVGGADRLELRPRLVVAFLLEKAAAEPKPRLHVDVCTLFAGGTTGKVFCIASILGFTGLFAHIDSFGVESSRWPIHRWPPPPLLPIIPISLNLASGRALG
jgi:hypothetical protein